jgi:hypothetical protein
VSSPRGRCVFRTKLDSDFAPSWTGISREGGHLTVARAWYRSDAYQRMLPLRLRHASGSLILIEGVDERHKAIDILG